MVEVAAFTAVVAAEEVTTKMASPGLTLDCRAGNPEFGFIPSPAGISNALRLSFLIVISSIPCRVEFF
jgi:hypothetical protein